MHYDSVLDYVRKVLGNNHIPTHIYENPSDLADSVDLTLHEYLFPDFDREKAFQGIKDVCRDNILYFITDNLYCSYVILKLPEPACSRYFCVGPFTDLDVKERDIRRIMEEQEFPAEMFPVLKNYYYNLAFVDSENYLKNLMGVLAEEIWQGSSNYSVSVHSRSIFAMPFADSAAVSDPESGYPAPVSIKIAEERYEFENRCMYAVSQGNLGLVDQLVSGSNNIHFIPRLADSLRDYKNYLIILNTLLRKAAEQGGVHPVYLDRLSSEFAKKIEELHTTSGNPLMKTMLHKYCLLVLNYSTRGYSPIIQKVINQINLNIQEDLSLKTLSEMFNISSGYLSTLFKKETDMTLTDYVNKKRVEHAVLLLNTTGLKIQTVASCCGINDINYFTRIFKKFMGMTPRDYRELISGKK